MLDTKQLLQRLADNEVELQKYQCSCRELEDRVGALDADNCQLKAQLAMSKDQLERIQHQLFEERKVCHRCALTSDASYVSKEENGLSIFISPNLTPYLPTCGQLQVM